MCVFSNVLPVSSFFCNVEQSTDIFFGLLFDLLECYVFVCIFVCNIQRVKITEKQRKRNELEITQKRGPN